ncbi:MAG: sigma-54-dependent Fis family transcriptional regulator, partial [Pirellulales bacterium]|nr:sigma-54-dependent Fis family transcriptional regulator [Pirellulales bacterium]
HKEIKSMSTAARRRLMAFDWPGNVRQLKNTVESMVVVDYDGVLDMDDLSPEMSGDEGPGNDAGGQGLSELVGKSLSEIEGLFLAETLKFTSGNREEAAGILGIGERTLYRKIKEYEL